MAKTYFHTCKKCGANLDPGETCDCFIEEENEAWKKANPGLINSYERAFLFNRCRELTSCGFCRDSCPLYDRCKEDFIAYGGLLTREFNNLINDTNITRRVIYVMHKEGKV